MQVFGLPGHVIRNGRAASRLLDAKPHDEAARRRDAVARWRRAMSDGLNAGQAAKAVIFTQRVITARQPAQSAATPADAIAICLVLRVTEDADEGGAGVADVAGI